MSQPVYSVQLFSRSNLAPGVYTFNTSSSYVPVVKYVGILYYAAGSNGGFSLYDASNSATMYAQGPFTSTTSNGFNWNLVSIVGAPGQTFGVSIVGKHMDIYISGFLLSLP